jgi:hypothetical protein
MPIEIIKPIPKKNLFIAVAADSAKPNVSMPSYFNGWQERVGVATDGGEAFVQRVIDKYIAFHNIENHHQGARAGHNNLTDDLYSWRLLPAVSMIFNHARTNVGREDSLHQAQEDSLKSIYTLDAALRVVEDYQNSNGLTNIRSAFNMLEEREGKDWLVFKSLMDTARYHAVDCIRDHKDQMPADMPFNHKNGFKKGNHETFQALADGALRDFTEKESGAPFQREFQQRLFSPDTQAVAVSMDFNSTINTGESYSNPALLEKLMDRLRILAGDFHEKFPEKKIFFVINTGRPALYEWGVLETIAAMPELRTFAVAESGNVLVSFHENQPEFDLCMDHKEDRPLYKYHMDEMRKYMAAGLAREEETRLIEESKMYLLSLQIAKRDDSMSSDENPYLYHVADGSNGTRRKSDKPADEDWFRTRMQMYFQKAITDLSKELDHLDPKPTEVEKTHLTAFIDGSEPAVYRDFEDNEEYGDRNLDLGLLAGHLRVLHDMQTNWQAKFNPTAGYLDIGDGRTNKYSAIVRKMRQLDINPSKTITIHIGDSTPDLIPEDKTGQGEVNENAQRVLLIAVANSNEKLINQVDKRGDYGYQTARESILGLTDVVTGLDRLITA